MNAVVVVDAKRRKTQVLYGVSLIFSVYFAACVLIQRVLDFVVICSRFCWRGKNSPSLAPEEMSKRLSCRLHDTAVMGGANRK